MKYPQYAVKFDGEPIGTIDIDLMLDELEVLETRAGMTYEEWIKGLSASSAGALRFVYWLALHRSGGADVRFSDINFRRSQITTELVDEGDFAEDKKAEDADDPRPTGSDPDTAPAAE